MEGRAKLRAGILCCQSHPDTLYPVGGIATPFVPIIVSLSYILSTQRASERKRGKARTKKMKRKRKQKYERRSEDEE